MKMSLQIKWATGLFKVSLVFFLKWFVMMLTMADKNGDARCATISCLYNDYAVFYEVDSIIWNAVNVHKMKLCWRRLACPVHLLAIFWVCVCVKYKAHTLVIVSFPWILINTLYINFHAKTTDYLLFSTWLVQAVGMHFYCCCLTMWKLSRNSHVSTHKQQVIICPYMKIYI